MKQHIKSVTLVVLLALLCALCAGCSGSGAANGVLSSFTATDLEGKPVDQSVLSDARLTMVNVWATYCGPCLSEMPELGELAKEYDPEAFQIIGIISDVLEGSGEETMTTAADLIAQTGADYPHLLLNESLYYALLTDVSAVPTTFFINENGEILKTVVAHRKNPPGRIS